MLCYRKSLGLSQASPGSLQRTSPRPRAHGTGRASLLCKLCDPNFFHLRLNTCFFVPFYLGCSALAPFCPPTWMKALVSLEGRVEAQQPWYSPCPLPDQFNKVHLKNRRWTPVLGSWGRAVVWAPTSGSHRVPMGISGAVGGWPSYMCPVSLWQLEGLLKLPKG